MHTPNKKPSGFTIVELLIVVVVIAILAAISVVAYTGIQNRAYDTSVSSDLAQIAKKMEIAKVEAATDAYPQGNEAMAAAFKVNVAKSAYRTHADTTGSYNLVFCWPGGAPTGFIIFAVSKSGKQFIARSGNGSVEEFTAASLDLTVHPGTECSKISTGYTASGAGYSKADTISGPWRAWAGGN